VLPQTPANHNKERRSQKGGAGFCHYFTICIWAKNPSGRLEISVAMEGQSHPVLNWVGILTSLGVLGTHRHRKGPRNFWPQAATIGDWSYIEKF